MFEFSEFGEESLDSVDFCPSEEEKWGDFDIPKEDTDVAELGEAETVSSELSEAEKAAEFAREKGFSKLGDYIEKNFDGETFDPDKPIPVKTRNMSLEGQTADTGVPFIRRSADLSDDLAVEGVFPEFDSLHHVELGSKANGMSLYEQFNACREDLQQSISDNHELRENVTFGEMERLAEPQGFTPEHYTWQHNPETGSFDLVKTDIHSSTGHTGGNAFWGK